MHFKKFISAMLSGVIAATSLFSTVTAEKQLLGYLGDVNFDSTISVADAVLLQKSLVTGLDGLSTDPNMQNADVNEDGHIDVFDAVLLRRCVLGECEWKGIYSEIEDPTEPPTEPETEPTTEAPTEPVTTPTTTAIPVTTTTTTTTTVTEAPETTTTTTALQMTLDDMPAEYQSAADWIWQNRVSAENSMGSSSYRWNNIFDQIIDGKGTLNYVVRWHSTKTITLQQRQKLEAALDDCINQWTDWLVGYEDWPYQHVDVKIVGWAVTDPSLLLDLQPDEVVYTDTTEYVIQPGESSEIPTVMANAPTELSRFDHFWDESYEYPGGLDKRFDQYLWATQGFPEYGGCGGDWGQRLGDNYYIGMAEGTHSKHVQIHEVGHGFGFTDFYGGEGASDGFPPGGFPGGGTSIMMAGSSSEITDFDGWFMRYTWSKIKDETNQNGVRRFNW